MVGCLATRGTWSSGRPAAGLGGKDAGEVVGDALPDGRDLHRPAGSGRLDEHAAAEIEPDVLFVVEHDKIAGLRLGLVDARADGVLFADQVLERNAHLGVGDHHQPGAVDPVVRRTVEHVRIAQVGEGFRDNRLSGSAHLQGRGDGAAPCSPASPPWADTMPASADATGSSRWPKREVAVPDTVSPWVRPCTTGSCDVEIRPTWSAARVSIEAFAGRANITLQTRPTEAAEAVSAARRPKGPG